jgi:hypothetical protein
VMVWREGKRGRKGRVDFCGSWGKWEGVGGGGEEFQRVGGGVVQGGGSGVGSGGSEPTRNKCGLPGGEV